MAIHKFTRCIAQGRTIPMFGDGSSRRDYTYISDIVDGVMAALERDFGFELFNLGESRTIALRDLIAEIERVVGRKAKIQRLPDQPGDVPIPFADVGKAREKLRYDPQVDIEQGVERFGAWWRRQNGM